MAPDGSQIGVKKINEALWLAEQLDLDLVEVAPNAKPPVCRLMDYGKYKYELSIKQREARKNQTRTSVKELRMKVRIGDHDFDITRRKTQDFLESGDKVKLTIRFRGREQERPGFGRDLLDRLANEVVEYGIVEQMPKLEGRSMSMVIAPVKRTKQSEPKATEPEPEVTEPEPKATEPEAKVAEPEPEVAEPEAKATEPEPDQSVEAEIREEEPA